MSILDNELICCKIVFIHLVTTFKRGSHGRLVFAKCVLPSLRKVKSIIIIYLFIFFQNLEHLIFVSE